MSTKKENPFYHNYLFSEEDLRRCTFRKRDRLWLWIFPTYVQFADGYSFYFKIVNGRYYLMKVNNVSHEEK